ncbi:hypothetical protein [Salinicola peritrichatus]|uniref:hypothetical protein n=1 Tax=Salinicola peritrichatus TaxID=1267424 RepID=UPI000DA13B61|nr:hypothetical protein [Salinicola peritrichatus]
MVRLARRLDVSAARAKLERFGAQRFEPAWLSLWAVAIGRPAQAPRAWLMAAEHTPRALLWPGALPAQSTDAEDGTALLDGGDCPSTAEFERWWLWERLARPRRWPLRVQPQTRCAVQLPLWLGYRDGRQVRLIVLSGLSGEALGALKPAVLAALRENWLCSPMRR